MKLHICLSLAVLVVIGCTDNSANSPGDARPTSDTSSTASGETDESQSFGDFSFSIPSGWTVVTPDRDKTKANDIARWDELAECEGNDQS